MATREELAALVAEGWALVPILAGAKRPTDEGWLTRVYTLDDFDATCNVGAKVGAPSGHRVDLDCDAPEAVRAARVMMPVTRVHGRPGKPSSHYWFTAPGTITEQFKDLSGEMLVEIRSTGCQTVIPPSRHASGEPITWASTGACLAISAEEMRQYGVQVALVSLLARHWPAGSRHIAAGHVGGFLARVGVPALLVEQMVRLIAQLAGDDEVEDRARFARESAQKYANGDKTTGAPGIRSVFAQGDDLVARLFSWLRREGDDELDTLNAQHFVVRVGKDVCVACEEDTGLDLQTFEGFSKLYMNRHVGKKRLGQFWLEHPKRRTYRRLVFAPPGASTPAGPQDYNLWRGFAVEPVWDPSAISRYLVHTHDIIANGDADAAEYVLDFLADIVQRPGTRLGKALALRGGQGVGKSLFVEAFGQLFGRHFISVNHREQIVGKFNAHLSGKVVVFADEAIWGGNRQDVGTLKHLITQSTINIQHKGIDISVEPNCIHLIMATNDKWVFPAGNNERRGVVLDVAIRRPRSYFEALVGEIQAPTFAPALLAFLLARPIDYARLRAGLDTAALRDQQAYSADVVQQWWQMMLDEGTGVGEHPFGEFISSEALYARFTDDMGNFRGAGFTQRGTRMQFMHRLLELLPSASLHTKMVTVNVAPVGPPQLVRMSKRGITLPPLATCRDQFNRVTGTRHVWGEIPPAQEPLHDDTF